MDKKLTAYILRYLLEHKFHSKAEMAEQLGIDLRTLQKVFENLDNAKAGTITLDKSILYCASHDVSIDEIMEDFIRDNGGIEAMREHLEKGKKACQRLQIKEPPALSPEGKGVFASMLHFLQNASAYICPSCERWCNPWDGEFDVSRKDCYIGHLAQSIQKSVAECYSARQMAP